MIFYLWHKIRYIFMAKEIFTFLNILQKITLYKGLK